MYHRRRQQERPKMCWPGYVQSTHYTYDCMAPPIPEKMEDAATWRGESARHATINGVSWPEYLQNMFYTHGCKAPAITQMEDSGTVRRERARDATINGVSWPEYLQNMFYTHGCKAPEITQMEDSESLRRERACDATINGASWPEYVRNMYYGHGCKAPAITEKLEDGRSGRRKSAPDARVNGAATGMQQSVSLDDIEHVFERLRPLRRAEEDKQSTGQQHAMLQDNMTKSDDISEMSHVSCAAYKPHLEMKNKEVGDAIGEQNNLILNLRLEADTERHKWNTQSGNLAESCIGEEDTNRENLHVMYVTAVSEEEYKSLPSISLEQAHREVEGLFEPRYEREDQAELNNIIADGLISRPFNNLEEEMVEKQVQLYDKKDEQVFEENLEASDRDKKYEHELQELEDQKDWVEVENEQEWDNDPEWDADMLQGE